MVTFQANMRRFEVFRFQFAGSRRVSAPGAHLVGPGDILSTGC